MPPLLTALLPIWVTAAADSPPARGSSAYAEATARLFAKPTLCRFRIEIPEEGIARLQSEVPLVNAGSVVWVITKGIRVIALRPNAERYDPVAEWKGPVNAITARPVFLGDRVLLWDSAALRMLRVAE
jgi:hypothetical protein